MTETQNLQSKFLISRSLFLGAGVSLVLTAGEKDAWIACILGFILGSLILFIYTKLSNSIEGSIHNYLIKKTPLNLLIRLSLLLFYLAFVFLLFIVFATFIYAYYLPFTKAIVSCAPFLFLAIYLGNKGTLAISRVAQILFWIALVAISIKVVAIVPYIKTENFLPIYTISHSKLFISTMNYAILTTAPYLLMLEDKCSYKTNLKSYFLTFLVIFIMIFYITGCFGSNLEKTFSYPEFTVLRLINYFNFIQNIESFLAINWVFDIFIALSYASKKIKDICHYKNNIFTYIILFILLFIVGNFVISDYKVTVTIFQNFVPILLIFLITILSLLGIKKGIKSISTVKYK